MPTANGTSVSSCGPFFSTCCLTDVSSDPRWASWNLGIFICIRCSGIHRGMGTHISRVKSVDLDAWTDEQLQSVLKWGNARANKYWEAKLAIGHVPSEAKIENFIRTKYESKRWVMEGPIPDPSTLDVEGDDDVPLSLVKEKHNIERSASLKMTTGRSAEASPAQSHVRRAPQPDLFGDDEPPQRASSAAPIQTRPPPPAKSEPAPPKQTKPADSLLGLDFFGTEASVPSRPSSAAPNPGAQSRPDLKQSILSLYASAPRPQPQQQQSQASFGGMQSPPLQQQQQQQSTFGGMNDAFSGLNFSNTSAAPVQAKPQQSAFAGLGNLSSHTRTPSQNKPAPNLGGGSFFDIKPSQPAQQKPQPQASRTFSSSSGFGDFGSAPAISPAPAQSSSGMDDLFDFASPVSNAPPPKQTVTSPVVTSPQASSVFNLSQPAQAPKFQAPIQSGAGDWSNSDAWGSNDTWGAAKTSPVAQKAAPVQASSGNFGWGSGSGSLANQSIVPGGSGGFATTSSGVQQPKVSADDDFGGWSSAAPVTPAANAQSKPAGGFGGNDDLFSNVWQ